MLIAGNTRLASLSVDKHRSSSKTAIDLQRTVHELQSAVEALQSTAYETGPACKKLEAVNELVCSSTGRSRDAVMAACLQAMARSVRSL